MDNFYPAQPENYRGFDKACPLSFLSLTGKTSSNSAPTLYSLYSLRLSAGILTWCLETAELLLVYYSGCFRLNKFRYTFSINVIGLYGKNNKKTDIINCFIVKAILSYTFRLGERKKYMGNYKEPFVTTRLIPYLDVHLTSSVSR